MKKEQFKKTGEELQGFLQFRKRGYWVKIRKERRPTIARSSSAPLTVYRRMMMRHLSDLFLCLLYIGLWAVAVLGLVNSDGVCRMDCNGCPYFGTCPQEKK